MTKLKQKYGLLIIGITLGILYGLASRMVMGANANLTTLSFMFLIPSILGIIPLMFADHQKLKSYRNIIFIPWLTVAAFFVVTLIFGIEDFLCLLVMAAPYFVFATLSALIFRFFQINKKKKKVQSTEAMKVVPKRKSPSSQAAMKPKLEVEGAEKPKTAVPGDLDMSSNRKAKQSKPKLSIDN